MTEAEGCYSLLTNERLDHATIETFTTSDLVTSSWGPMQHGGPVAGLLARAIENLAPRPGTRISKVSIDILGPIPIAEVRVTARISRPGRKVQLLTAMMNVRRAERWRLVATASAWQLATSDTADVIRHAVPAIPAPDGRTGNLGAHIGEATWDLIGSVTNVDWQIPVRGGAPGEPTIAWARLKQPLVTGEPTSDLAVTMAMADMANGVGAHLDPAEFTFLNTELTVHLHDRPQGPWIGIQAESTIGADGIGLSHALLHNPAGPIGHVAQNLLVERRPGAPAYA